MTGVLRRTMTFLAFASVAACGGGGGGGGGDAAAPPPPPPPASSPPPATKDFVDVTSASNIDYVVQITAPPLSRSGFEIVQATNGGAAAGDCNGDDLIDVFITAGEETNRLYVNQGNFTFADRTSAAGLSNAEKLRHSGPTFADMNGDGHLDLFLGGLFNDSNKIYQGLGDCTFLDVTPPEFKGPRDGGSYLSTTTFSAGFGDYDLDGDLDMFLTHWGTHDEIFEAGNPSETEHLWRNDSTHVISFTNVSMASGVSEIRWADREFTTSNTPADLGFTPTFARLDADLWPDLLLASDFGTTQALLNNGDFTFTAVADSGVLRAAQWGMGSALGDFDNDGDLDWFVTSIFGGSNDPLSVPHGNRLYLNEFDEGREFTDISAARGVANGSWGWGACFLDIDNDTDLDLFHTNGWPFEFFGDTYLLDKSRAFINDGTGHFTNQAPSLGVDADRDGRGVVCADFDNDGDIDILELTSDAPRSAIMWENDSAAAGNNFLRVKLEGLPPNTEASGARIFVTIGSKTQMREVMIGSNYTSQNPAIQIFGLGPAAQIDELRVEWPAIASGPGAVPKRPDDTIMNGVAAGVPGAPMVIRHPELP